MFDSSISLSGDIDLIENNVYFRPAVLVSTVPSYLSKIVMYTPNSIEYDSTGYLSGYVDTMYCSTPTDPALCRNNRLYNQQLLFPPSPKSAVEDVRVMSDIVNANFEVIDSKVKIILLGAKQTDAVVSLVDLLGRKVSTLYAGLLNEHTILLTDANSGRGQVMFLEVSIKGMKQYFKLPFVF